MKSLIEIHAIDASNLPSSVAVETRQLTPAERLGRPGAQTGVALARLLGQLGCILCIFSNFRYEINDISKSSFRKRYERIRNISSY